MFGLPGCRPATPGCQRGSKTRFSVKSQSFVIPLIGVCFCAGYALVSLGINRYRQRRQLNANRTISEADCRRILNVSWLAGEEEIETAYLRLRSMYAPENFAHLDEEFR